MRRPIGSDGARAATRILTEPEPTAADVARLDQIMAAAHDGEPAPPGAFTEAIKKHCGRPVLMAVDYSYFLSGRGPQDISKVIADITDPSLPGGTCRLGPPLPMDDPVGADPEPEPERPGEEDEPPGEVAPAAQDSQAAGYDFDYADDNEYRGNIDANELTEAEEAYRAVAYEAVLHYTRDYDLEIFPVCVDEETR